MRNVDSTVCRLPRPASRRFSVSRLFAGFVALLIVAATGPAKGQECFKPGDTTGDGSTDLSDAMAILNTVAFNQGCGPWQGDVDRDGIVDLTDAMLLIGWMFHGTSLPSTEPVCGPVVIDSVPEAEPDFAIEIAGPNVTDATVEYALRYRSPLPLRGLQLHFSGSENLSLLGNLLVLEAPKPGGVNRVSLEETNGRTLVAFISTGIDPEVTFQATVGEWQPLGKLRLIAADPNGDTTLAWKPVIDRAGCSLRAHFVTVDPATNVIAKHYPVAAIRDRDDIGFQRGSMGLEALWSYFLGAPSAPVNCQGVIEPEIADVNDNESLTVADFMLLRHTTLAGGSVPSPSARCGLDPNDDDRGFATLDATYQLTATEVVSIRPEGGRVTAVHIPIAVDSPTDVVGAQFVVEYNAEALTPYSDDEGGAFKAPNGKATMRVVEADGKGLLVVALVANKDGDVIRAAAPGIFVQLGTLRFHLKPTLDGHMVFEPIHWRAEAEIGGIKCRASIVDPQFNDHHPDLVAGVYKFVRGNSNSDASVDISDAQFTFDYLFKGGETPHCLRATDANSDGEIDISDGIFTLQYLFLGGDTFKRPFPQCGLGVLIDELGCNEPRGDDVCAR